MILINRRTMSGFKALRQVSGEFSNELKTLSTELFAVQVGATFDEVVSKKLKDLALYSSKLKLLRANPLSLTPQISSQDNEDAIQQLQDAAVWKVVEQMTVKCTTQGHAVKELLTTPDEELDQESLARKEEIARHLKLYRQKETELRLLDGILKEKQQEEVTLRSGLDAALADMRDTKEGWSHQGPEYQGPLYMKLMKHIKKLQVMTWLLGRLVTARGCYDWLADPRRRLAALPLARERYTLHTFIE